jgi:hypothetical protein
VILVGFDFRPCPRGDPRLNCKSGKVFQYQWELRYCLIYSLHPHKDRACVRLIAFCLLYFANRFPDILSTMTWLRPQIESLRCEVDNGDSSDGNDDRFIIPHQQLYRLMTRNVVLDALQECEHIPAYHVNGIVERVMKGGLRLFSILIVVGQEKSILRFIERDGMQRSGLDDKLPFSADELQAIIPETDGASDFFKRQWEFVAPVFSRNVLHRSLNSKIRLPFVQNKKIDEGGFGVVYEIKLHPDHQKLPLIPQDKVSAWLNLALRL